MGPQDFMVAARPLACEGFQKKQTTSQAEACGYHKTENQKMGLVGARPLACVVRQVFQN
jgi:hypothetical protein